MSRPYERPQTTTLALDGTGAQVWEGFGGCFNELSQMALLTMNEADRGAVYNSLFSESDDSLRLNFCRIPIGANDYSESWYSYNETDEDYQMEHFSIERDKKYIIPYIKEAQKRNPGMKFFASPWSPPTWMKYPKAHNYGTLVMTRENLDAYALYLLKFVRAYEEEGIHIEQLHVQNEPISHSPFPSCVITGEQFAEFIGKYLGPLFERNGITTKIWLGTINAPEVDGRKLYTRYNHYANLVLHDDDAYRYTEGVSYQWSGQNTVRVTRQSFPEKKLAQSENECGDGENSWEYAKYIYEMFRTYLTDGVNMYCYWNMVLAKGGMSTWGWNQNSMVTVAGQKAEYQHEFYVMKHFSRFIEPGAVRLNLKGHFTGTSVAFRNPNGQLVLVCQNPFPKPYAFVFGGETVTLAPDSINTILP